MQTAGIDGFKLFISDTGSAEPVVRAEKLGPTTWYEFTVAALNYNGAGPPGAPSEPVLTAAHGAGGVAGVRRRRTAQTGATALKGERDALDAASAKEAALKRELEASAASVEQWASNFEVRLGRPPTADDRANASALRHEARHARELRHAAALA